MERSFCPPNFGIIFGIGAFIKLLHDKTPHICVHTLWHERIARATTECTGIAIERKQHTTWLSQCVPSKVRNSRNLISFLKRKDNLLWRERDKVRMYMIMNKGTQRIRKLVKWQDVETNVRELTKQRFLFCSPSSAYVIQNLHLKGVIVPIPCVTVDHCSHEIWLRLGSKAPLSIPFLPPFAAVIVLAWMRRKARGWREGEGARHARKAS